MNASPTARPAPLGHISWEEILTNLDDGVIAVDTDGRIGFFNEAAETMTEVSSATAYQQPMESIFRREPWLLELVAKTQPPRQPNRGR